MAAQTTRSAAGCARGLRGHTLGAAALLATATPLAAQEAPAAAGGGAAPAPSSVVSAGPIGAPIGGGSLADVEGRPASGSGVRLGAFGATFGGPTSPPEAAGRAWTIAPGIAVGAGATNNVFQTRDDTRSDTFIGITPSILINGESTRIRASLNYEPTAQLYATYTSQNRVTQIGGGQLLAELLPGALYLDVRGSASLATTSGGFVPGTAQTANRNDQVQYYNFQVAPYFVHRFGSMATAQVGYVFQYSAQDGTTGFQPGASQPFFNNQDYTSNRGYAVLRTGEDFGRLAMQARVDGTSFSGTGVYDGAHAFFTTLEARYAILPSIAVLLEGGYENIEYAGTNPTEISDAIWGMGVRFTPTRDTFLVARYGHRGGFNSPSLEAGIQLGAYTRLTASYSERLATNAMVTQDLLNTTVLDAAGNAVDSQSGAPVLYANSFFPASSGLFRTKLGSVGLTFAWPRDSVTLSAFYQQQEPVSAAVGTQISESTGYYGGISWTHEISPRTSVNAQIQIGRTEFVGSPSSNVLAIGGGVSHQLTERMRAIVQVFYDNRTSSLAANEYAQATILAGVSRSF
jgi:uncharacterized protein (PEP-CTERM system associated)